MKNQRVNSQPLVNDTTDLDSLVSLTLLTLLCGVNDKPAFNSILTMTFLSGFRGVNDTAELDSELHSVINTAESDSVVSMTQYIFAHIVQNQNVQICMQN